MENLEDYSQIDVLFDLGSEPDFALEEKSGKLVWQLKRCDFPVHKIKKDLVDGQMKLSGAYIAGKNNVTFHRTFRLPEGTDPATLALRGCDHFIEIVVDLPNNAKHKFQVYKRLGDCVIKNVFDMVSLSNYPKFTYIEALGKYKCVIDRYGIPEAEVEKSVSKGRLVLNGSWKFEGDDYVLFCRSIELPGDAVNDFEYSGEDACIEIVCSKSS